MARVSVVLPTADSKEALLTTVDSVLSQDYSDYELLISDDGSTDETGPDLLARLGPDPSRVERVWRESLRESTGTRSIRMVHNGTLVHYLQQIAARGPGTSRNRGVVSASGELLAFAEPGDVWCRHKLATMVELLDANQSLGACLENHEIKRARRASPRKKVNLQAVTFTWILECPEIRLSGSLLRRQCLESETPFDENLPVCEEYDFWLRMASRYALGRLEEPLQFAPPRKVIKEWGLERFRVYALEKAYQGGHLSPTMRHRVAEELVHQCNLLVEGYRHRDNLERANFYDRKKKRFAQEVAKLDVSDPIYSEAQRGKARLSGAPI
jgi:hypothetical protein